MTEGSCDSSRDTMIVATANVRTLHPKEEKESRSRFGGTTMLGKLELLEIAMHDTATDVVGLQESRSRQAEIFHGVFYRKYCDTDDSNGNASCQLWVTASSPRLLVVHWASSELWTPVELCCYPSDIRRETNILDTFWAAMKKLKTSRSSRRIVFID